MSRVTVVGPGWRFTSGISYYTCRLSNALADEHQVQAVLMRRLIPARFYPGRGRVGRAVHELAYRPEVEVIDGVDWYWGATIIHAVRALRRSRPEVLVLQWWTGAVLHSYLVLAATARLLGAKVIIEYHETQDTGEVKVRGAARYVGTVGRLLTRLSHASVVHSDFDRTAVATSFRLPPGHPIEVITSGPYDHHQAPKVAGGLLGVHEQIPDDGRRVVLFFGTIRPYKGLEHLVTAFNGLRPEQAAQLHLLIVGETWEGWTEPLELAARSPYRERITVINRYVTDPEVAQAFALAQVVALPYLRSSASGPLHIAMSLGLPVLLGDVGGLRDGAGSYDGVHWVAPGDAEALRDALVGTLESPATRHAQTRTWPDVAEEYGRVFDATLD